MAPAVCLWAPAVCLSAPAVCLWAVWAWLSGRPQLSLQQSHLAAGSCSQLEAWCAKLPPGLVCLQARAGLAQAAKRHPRVDLLPANFTQAAAAAPGCRVEKVDFCHLAAATAAAAAASLWLTSSADHIDLAIAAGTAAATRGQTAGTLRSAQS